MYAEYTQPQLTFLALVPCIHIKDVWSVSIGLTYTVEDISFIKKRSVYINVITGLYYSVYTSMYTTIHL